jgi:hypothetical protein
MSDNHTIKFIDAGNAESEIYEPGAEVKQEFAEAQLISHATEPFHRDEIFSSRASAAAAREYDFRDGEEAVGGFNTTPDDDLVDEIGEAVGLVYQDDEPLHTAEKVEARDKKRWELDPASSEDYQRRVNHEGE